MTVAEDAEAEDVADAEAVDKGGMKTMNAEYEQLYQEIEGFCVDGSDRCQPSLPFISRLARENGWTEIYAARVVEEYRRFLLLAATSGHPVTPSDQVDQAWHLHLLYTRSWSRFCTEVLARPLHHEPTRGGPEEKAKFKVWYERTLASYQRFFGNPPADIWPDSSVRFGQDLHYQRVNTKRFFIVPKVWGTRAALACLAAIATMLLAAGL